MNKFKSYIVGTLAMMALACGFTSCQDHFDAPDLSKDGPVASLNPNTTIAELKEWMWRNDLNYCDTVYTRDYFTGATTDQWEGEHVIISGRVISSDYEGNCFKYIILQDETGALSFSINSYNLYLEYRRGQEIVVDLTGLFAGKYRGLFQIGFPSWNSSSNGYETSFLAPELFVSHRELNGWPQIQDIDTIEISSFSELGTAPSQLQKWQSQLIRINNVTFEQSSDAAAEGITTLSTYHSSGVSQTIVDADGGTGAVRTSGYATFWNLELPEGTVDVVLLASYYGSNESNAAWQFTLIDANGIITDPTVPKGSKDNPYSIGEAIELQSDPTQNNKGWVEGYLVGTVAPEVTEINSNADIEWSASPILGNTMVIAPTPDCTDISQCLVLELIQNSSLANQALREKPENYKKKIAINASSFTSVLGTFGLVTSCKLSDYVLEGFSGSDVPEGVYTVAQALEILNSGNIPTEAVQVMGYIQSIDEIDPSYGNATYNIIDDGGTTSLKIYRGYWFNGAKFTSTDQLEVGAEIIVEGTLVMYYNTPEMAQGNKVVRYQGQTSDEGSGGSTPSQGEGSGTEDDPYNVSAVLSLGTGANVNAYVKGYIVGNAPGQVFSQAIFTAEGASASNVLLADSPTCKDYSQCIPLQLVSGTDIRKSLNLIDNPGNIGAEILVCGKITAYFGVPGIKEPTYAKILSEGNSGDDSGNDTPAVPGAEVVLDNWTATNWTGGADGWEGVVNGYTLKVEKGGSSSTMENAKPNMYAIRVYKNGYFTITAPEGVRFTEVRFDLDSTTTAYTASAPSGWTATTGSSNNPTFTVSSKNASNSLKLTASAGQIRIAKITVVTTE